MGKLSAPSTIDLPAVVEDPVDVLGGEPLAVGRHLDVGVERLDRALRAVDLRRAERVQRVRDLPLQVRLVDDVGVDDPEVADAGRGEVQRGRRAEAAGAEQQDLRVEQLELALLADLGDQRGGASSARAARARACAAADDVVAVALPVGEAAGERDDVLVAELARASSRRRRSARRRRSRGRAASSRSGTTPSMRDSRLPRGTCTAPGMWPSSHSSLLAHVDEARVRRGRWPSRASTSAISSLILLEEFPVRRHGLKRIVASRSGHPGYLGVELSSRLRVRRSSSPSLAVVAAGVGRRRHARDAADADQPKALPGSRRCRQGAADAGGRADPRRVPQRGRTGASTTMESARPRVPEATRVVQLYRGLALLWAGYPADAEVALRSGEEGSAATRLGGRRPTTSSTREYFRSDYPTFRPLAARTRCSSGLAPAGAGPPALGRAARLRAGRAAQRRTTTRPRSPRRSAASTRTTSTPSFSRLGPLTRSVPEEPVGPLLPRPAARLDGPARRGDRAVPEGGRARPEHRRSAQARRQFLDERSRVGPARRPNEPVGLWRPSGR